MFEIITQFFKSDNPKRQEELDYCFQKNLENKYINKIHFLYENKEDLNYSKKFNSDKIIYYNLGKRINYKKVFEYSNSIIEKNINQKINNQTIFIYLHADMQITEDIKKINDKNFNDNTIITLTSHHPFNCNKLLKCNCTRQYKTDKGLYGVTFDGFIFQGIISNNIISKLDYEVNHMGAENKLIYEFKINNYNVICPNKDIRAEHYHITQFHNRKDWISIDNSIKPLKYYQRMHKLQKVLNYPFANRLVGGGIPFYLGSAKLVNL